MTSMLVIYSLSSSGIMSSEGETSFNPKAQHSVINFSFSKGNLLMISENITQKGFKQKHDK